MQHRDQDSSSIGWKVVAVVLAMLLGSVGGYYWSQRVSNVDGKLQDHEIRIRDLETRMAQGVERLSGVAQEMDVLRERIIEQMSEPN